MGPTDPNDLHTTGHQTAMRLSVLLIIVLLGAVVAGGVFLTTWEIPAPTHRVEKVIPNDQFE